MSLFSSTTTQPQQQTSQQSFANFNAFPKSNSNKNIRTSTNAAPEISLVDFGATVNTQTTGSAAISNAKQQPSLLDDFDIIQEKIPEPARKQSTSSGWPASSTTPSAIPSFSSEWNQPTASPKPDPSTLNFNSLNIQSSSSQFSTQPPVKVPAKQTTPVNNWANTTSTSAITSQNQFMPSPSLTAKSGSDWPTSATTTVPSIPENNAWNNPSQSEPSTDNWNSFQTVKTSIPSNTGWGSPAAAPTQNWTSESKTSWNTPENPIVKPAALPANPFAGVPDDPWSDFSK